MSRHDPIQLVPVQAEHEQLYKLASPSVRLDDANCNITNRMQRAGHVVLEGIQVTAATFKVHNACGFKPLNGS